jgi:hypothetical protein
MKVMAVLDWLKSWSSMLVVRHPSILDVGFFPGIPHVGFLRMDVRYNDQFHEVEEDPGMSKE